MAWRHGRLMEIYRFKQKYSLVKTNYKMHANKYALSDVGNVMCYIIIMGGGR